MMSEGTGFRVNGAVQAAERMTIVELLRRLGADPPPRFVAVAVNGSVVRRDAWAATEVAPGDEIEIVRPLQVG